MKNLIKITAITLLAINLNAVAQKNDNTLNQKVEAARIGMITNRLNLTTSQATAFWPIYNEYDDRKTEIRNGLKTHLSESRSLASTDEKILTELKEMMNLRQKEVDLERESMTKFLKVLNPRQVTELYRTEQMFKQMLLRKLENRNGQYRHENGMK